MPQTPLWEKLLQSFAGLWKIYFLQLNLAKAWWYLHTITYHPYCFKHDHCATMQHSYEQFLFGTRGKYLYICYLSCRRRPTCWCPWWLCSCVPGFRSISWMFWWTWAFWKLCSGTSAQHNSHNHLRQININIYENFVDNHMVQKHSSVYHLRPFINNIKYVYIIYPQHS